MRRRSHPAVASLVVCAALVGGADEPASARAGDRVRPATLAGPLGSERLSDEERVTRHAHARTPAPVRRRPLPDATVVARLRYVAEDRSDEVYLVVRSRVDAAGQTWLRVRVPQRPRPLTGWVVREALGELVAVRTKLEVDRTRLRARLRIDGRTVWRSAIGVGKPATPTPSGRYWVRSKMRSRDPRGTYGPWAFGTSAYSVLSDWPAGGIVGIHGTNQPELVPGRPSHGCVRVPNDSIRRLARLMPVGTPIEIR